MWFKDKKKSSEDGAVEHKRTGAKNVELQGAVSGLRTRAVLFIEQTFELAKKMREQLVNLDPTLGFKATVVERTGRNILTTFPQTRTWGAIQCGREECVTCNQGMEELPDCMKHVWSTKAYAPSATKEPRPKES